MFAGVRRDEEMVAELPARGLEGDVLVGEEKDVLCGASVAKRRPVERPMT
jgi:hypothetical protein